MSDSVQPKSKQQSPTFRGVHATVFSSPSIFFSENLKKASKYIMKYTHLAYFQVPHSYSGVLYFAEFDWLTECDWLSELLREHGILPKGKVALLMFHEEQTIL